MLISRSMVSLVPIRSAGAEVAKLASEREVLEALHRFGSDITAQLDPARVLVALTEEAPRLTGAHMAVFVVRGEEAGCVVEAASGTIPLAMAPHLCELTDIWRGFGAIRMDEITLPACRDLLPGARSLLGVPMVLRSGQVVGALFLGHFAPAAFTDRHEWLAVGMASWSAAAYENARRHEESREAENRKALLAEAGALLAASLDYETTLRSVARLAVPRLADWCTLDLLDGDGRIRRLEVAHADPERVRLVRSLECSAPRECSTDRGIGQAVATGRSILHPDITEEILLRVARSTEHYDLLRSLGLRSAMVVPLVARGRTVGVISLVAAESGRRFTSSDLALAEDLASRAALAVDNARLYRETQAAAGRSRFMAEASRVLSSSLDYRETLESLARLTVPDFADWCVVDLLDPTGEVDMVAVAHADPEREVQVRELRRCYPLSRNHQAPAARVIEKRRAILLSDAERDLLDNATDARHRRLLEALEPRSVIAVPLAAHGRTLGAITFVSTRPDGYGRDELAIAEKLADRAALAIDNARLYARERETQEKLKSLLHHEREMLKRMAASFLGKPFPFESVEMASDYVPAYAAERIGGDYYDFIRLGPSRMAVVVGDVCGKGLHAGAYTAMVKYHLRAYALEDPEPVRVFGRLNQALYAGMHQDEMFVTLVYVVLDTDAGTLTYANAGHPAPVLLDPRTGPRRLEATGGLMGALPGLEYRQANMPLPEGALLALFTDGITEAAGELDPDGDGGVGDLLAASPTAPLQQLADDIVEHARKRASGVFKDDVALVVVRRR